MLPVLVAALLHLFAPSHAAAQPKPIASYSFDEGKGEIAHDSSGNHDGTINGAEWTEEGKHGGGLQFDGENDIVTIPDSEELDLEDGFTLEAWVRPKEERNWSSLIAKEDSGEGLPFGYLLYAQGGGEFPAAYVAEDDTTYHNIIGEGSLPTETWSHLALVSDTSQMRIYVDGKLVNSENSSPVKETDGPLRIGGNEVFGEYFEGRVDDVRLYKNALGSGEIEEDMGIAVGLAKAPEPVSAYSFDEGEGAAAFDAVGENDATIKGATWTDEGKYGSALEFDGENDIVTIPADASLDFANGFTFEAWIRPNSTTNLAPILSRAGPGEEIPFSYRFYARNGEGLPSGAVQGVSSQKEVSGLSPLPLNTWTHIAITSDGRTMHLYRDGSLETSGDSIPLKVGGGSVQIGGDEASAEYFSGRIDEVRLSDRVLTSEEIERHLNIPVEDVSVAAWGDNDGGQLGVLSGSEGPGPSSSPLYRHVPLSSAVVQVAGGGYTQGFFSALHANGTVTAWGSDCGGALGVGYTGFCNQEPTEVSISNVIQVASGRDHTLYLTEGGLKATGNNNYGELGNTGFIQSYTPKPVLGLENAVMVAAGGRTSYALTSDGRVWVWGINDSGEFGDGTTCFCKDFTPQAVPDLDNIVKIGAGWHHAYALRSDGTVWAWGTNSEGQLGNGGTTDSPVPTQVSNLTNVVALASGGATGNTSYAIRNDGTLWSWGDNSKGQLGSGSLAPYSVAPVQVSGISDVVAVAGGTFGAIAITNNGSIWTWGSNEDGLLGNGTSKSSSVPVRVKGIQSGVAVAMAGRSAAASAKLPEPPEALRSKELFGGSNPSEYCPCAQGHRGDPVNTADGNFYETYQDLSVPGRGPALALTRTYNSLAASGDAPFGYGWSFNYGMKLSEAEDGTVTIVQENGSQISFMPNGSGGYVAPSRVLASLSREGETWTLIRRSREKFDFDGAGRLIAQTDLNGYVTTLSYPSASSIVVTDPTGRTISFTLSGGHVTKVADTASPPRTIFYRYTEVGELKEVEDVEGGITTFTYDGAHRLLTIREPKYASDKTTTPSPIISMEYDESGRVTAQTDQIGRTTTFDYTSIPSATEVTSPEGNVALDRYDDRGLRQSETRAYGTGEEATWTYYYDPRTLARTGVCDPNEHCVTDEFDDRGNRIEHVDALGNATTYTYDGLNDLTSRTDAKGVTTTLTYDAQGNLLEESTPLAGSEPLEHQTWVYSHDDELYPGDVTAVTDPNGHTTDLAYDETGDLESVTDAEGDETTYSYDGIGRLVSKTMPLGNAEGGTPADYTTTYESNAFGDTTEIIDPLEGKTVVRYDENRNVASTTDGDGNETKYVFDPANQLIEVERADKSVVKTGYDEDGNLSSQTNGGGKATGYAYNHRDQLVSITDPLSRVTKYSYDLKGNLLEATDSLSRTTTYDYDRADRPISIDYSSAGTPDVTFSYDSVGQPTAMSDGTGSSTFTYDSLRRLTQSTQQGITFNFGYDLANNETSVGYPGSKTVSRQFDDANRLELVADWSGRETGFDYDANSNLTSIVFPSGTTNVDEYEYDKADRLSSIAMKKGASVLASVSYERDPMGQLKKEEQSGLPGTSAISYTYTPLNQIASAGGSAYGYDGADNPTKIAGVSGYKYDSASQLESTPSGAPGGEATFSYDSLGERTERKPKEGSAVKYTYDQAGRLTAAGSASYAYGGDGLRLAKTIGKETQHFSWDRSSGLPFLLSDGSTNYIYGPGGLPIEQVSAGGTPTYFHHDQLGSTRMLTNSSGSSTGAFSYAPFGSLSGSSGEQTTPLGFAGEYTDPESGLQYLRARYYDPATGQFLSRDPIEAITRQPYGYVNQNPLNWTDPSGLFSTTTRFGPPLFPLPDPRVTEEAIEETGHLLSETIHETEETASRVWDVLAGDNSADDQLTLTKEEQEYEEEHHECPVELGRELKREGEELLGRGHSDAGRERWNNWWKERSNRDKKSYKDADGPKPGKRNKR